MCFGGKSQPAPAPPNQTPGRLDVSKATPDPSQAYRYRGEDVGENTTGRTGGGLLVESANKAAALKQTTGA